MSLVKTIARNLDEPARIVGLSPLELASCAVFYAVLSPLLRGIPFSGLLSLVAAFGFAGVFLILNRSFPPSHGVFFVLQLFRPKVNPVMAFGSEGRS